MRVAIDRARFGKTWIKRGAKIDNLVQIAHNVVIGELCFIIAQRIPFNALEPVPDQRAGQQKENPIQRHSIPGHVGNEVVDERIA